MKKVIIALILMLMAFNVFSVDVEDNNAIEKHWNGTLIEQKSTSLDEMIEEYTEEEIIEGNDTYYNKYGGINRTDLEGADIIIEDKLISVRDYEESWHQFEVVMYVGTDNVKYAIMHHDNSTDYNYISMFGEYIGDAVSKEGYLYYDTNRFSTQIATIPSHYSTGEIQESGGQYRSVVADELEIFLDDYFTRVKRFTICDIRDCTSSPIILDEPTTADGTIPLDRGVVSYDIDSDDYDTQLIEINTLLPTNYQSYNKGFYAHNDELEIQVKGDDDKYYYSGFYLNYFFPDEPVQYGQTSMFSDTLDNPSYIHTLDDNDAFVQKGFSSTLITLDDDENFGFKINEHFLNYDTWGFRLNDELGDPIIGKELSRYMTGCQSYSGADIEVQICSNGYKQDMVYIRPQGVEFDGDIEIYVQNDEYDSGATEKAYTIDLDINSPTIAPVVLDTIDDINLGYYSYDSIVLDDYFSGYTSFDVDIDNTGCEISKNKNEGSPSTCDVSGVTYVVYPSGLITIESTNTQGSVPLWVGVTNDYGTQTDAIDVIVGDTSTGLTDDINTYYTFDTDDVTGSTLIDVTGNGNDGTCSMDSGCDSVTGHINEGSDFDGSNDYIDLGSQIALGSYSVSTWFYSDLDGEILFRENIGSYAVLSVGAYSTCNANKVCFKTYDGNYDEVSSTDSYISGWNHVVAIHDQSSSVNRLYLNGVSQGTISAGNQGGYSNFMLGSSSSGYEGLIDEFGLWTKVLDSDDVDNLYNSGTGLSYDSFDSGGSPAIPPGVNQSFSDITLLPVGVRTFDLNQYFYGYDAIELKYYSENLDEWFVVDLDLTETRETNILGNIIIQLDVGTDSESVETIYATIKGNSLEYDDLVYITASNEVGATTPQTFNVYVNYTSPVDQLPDYYSAFTSVGLEYNDVENINLNDNYNYYDYITLSIGSEEITIYLNGSNDFGNITTSEYNVSLENIGTYIALTILSYEEDSEFDINIIACNDDGCDSERTFSVAISEAGDVPSDVPDWFPNPPEGEKLYWAIGIMVIFIVGVSFIGASEDVGLQGIISFGLIGLFALFLMFSIIGWIPIWILVLLVIVVVGYVSFMLKNVIGGN